MKPSTWAMSPIGFSDLGRAAIGRRPTTHETRFNLTMTIDSAREQARIDAAKNTLATAQQAYNDGVRGLLASDARTPIYAPDEHERRTAALRDALAAKLATVDAQADSVIASIESARLNPFADPLAALDLANLELAGTHRVFVAEDCATLPVPELVGRLEWAAKHPGAYLRVLYGRYGVLRFKALLDAKPQPDGLTELRLALESLGAIGGAKGLSSELQELRYRADAVKRATAYALAGGGKAAVGSKIVF